MKKLKQLILSALLLVGAAHAQEVKNQSEIIKKNFKEGSYKVIANLNSSIHMGRTVNLTKIAPDKSKPEDNLEIKVQMYPDSPTDSEREARLPFFADKEIFPVTYMATYYEGNKQMQEQNGYVVRRGKRPSDRRLVFIDNYIFYLTEWKDKDDYSLTTILGSDGNDASKDKKEKKKKKGGFFKKLKETMKAASEGGGGSNAKMEKLKTEVLQPYLDAATAMQNKMESSPEALKAKRDAAAISKKMDASIDSFNNVVYVNKTGKTIYIYRGNSTKGAMYSNGAKIKFPCTSGLNYDFTGKKWYYPNKAINLNTAGTTKKCGKTIEIK